MNSSQTIISTPPDSHTSESGDLMDPEVERRELTLGAQHHQQRLDRVLVDLVAEFSRSYLQQLIEHGDVWINGKPIIKASQRIRMSDRVRVDLRPTPQSQAFKAESMRLDLVYQDEHLLVINKPAGLVVHPAPGNWSGTLMNGLLGFDPQAFYLPRAGIVHRLDKDTSGLMVVARTRVVMDALVKAIAARTVKRQYLALAHGSWLGDTEQTITQSIGRDPGHRLRMAVVDLAQHAGKVAATDVCCLDSVQQGCLVHCALQTGRTHQIRVHLAWLGHPLVADSLYGGSMTAGMQRQALHAFKLSFAHPVTGHPMVFTAETPRDFANAIDHWGLKYNAARF